MGFCALSAALSCARDGARRIAPPPIAPVAPPEAKPKELLISILSLNDLHGKLGALPAFAGYVAALRRERGEQGAVLVVDAGDMFQGTLGSNQSEGQSVIQSYNLLGVSAAALGNHEFDYGPLNGASDAEGSSPTGALRARIAEARFPILSANLVERASRERPAWKNLHPDAIVEAAGVRLGFVGLLTSETESIVMPDYFAGLAVAPLAPALESSATALRAAGADSVVAIAHAGADCKRFDDPNDLSSCDRDSAEIFALARALPRGLVDAIVAGHTHAGVAHVENGIVIEEAFSRGKAFGRIDLKFGGAPRRLLEARPFPPEALCPDSAELAPCPTHAYANAVVTPSAELEHAIEPALAYARRARTRYLGPELLGEVSAAHDRESALGNLFVDAMRAFVRGSDVAIINGGGLRAPLPKGPLAYGSLYEAMPFDNRVVKVTLTAAELKRVLAAHVANDAHGIVSLSGLRAKATCRKRELEISLVRSDGRALRDDAEIVVVTSDYLATGGDRLFAPIALDRSRIQPIDDTLLRDALAASLSHSKQIDPRDPVLLDAAHPRLALPTARPVRCNAP